MRKKLIKKGQGGLALLSNQLMGQSSMNFSQPLTDLNDPMLDKLSSPMGNIKLNKLTTPNLVMKGPDTSKIVSGLNSTLFDTGFQNRMAKGQSDHMKQMKSAQNKQKWGDFKKGVGEFINSESGKTAGGILGSLTDSISANVGEGDRSMISSGLSTIGDVAMGIDPVTGMVIKGLGLLNQATSKQTDTNINSGISGYGGTDINESKTFDGFNRLIGNEQKYKAGLIGRKKLAMTGKTNAEGQLKQIAARNQAIGNTGMDNQKKLSGGLDYSVLTAKKGATLQDIRNYIKVRNIEREVVQNPNLDDNLEKIEVSKFQNGGSLIPSGALHKNKHKIESVNPELDGEITKKGIPVISYAEEGDVLEFENDGKTPKVLAEGGEVIQHAEIEKDEVILNLSLTKKLIELMKKDTPEAMIEAGKILARELMEDTTDNTGLIEKTIGNED